MSTLRIEDLSPAKRELLRRRLGQLQGDAPAPAAAAPRPEVLPLSFSQERLWFLEQLEAGPRQAGATAYNMSGAHLLRGALDEGVFARALTEVVRRHEILRTTFPAPGGEPRQRIAERPHLPLTVVDLGSLAADRRRREAGRLARRVAARPFDLARGPLLRVALVRLAAAESALLLGLHHIISDGWSMRVLVRDLTAIYQAYRQRRPSPLPELPYQYADFAIEQRRRLQGEALRRHLDYWKRRLEAIPETLELPADRPRPAVASHRGGRRSIVVSGELAERLKALAKREGKTPFMVLLAVLDCFLYRISGQADLVVGTPMANRDQLETEGLVGCFVNTLVLRIDLGRAGRTAAGDPGSPAFSDLLERVRETVLDAHAHQELPFEKLVEELQPERSLSRSPLFQVLFAYQNIPGGTGGSGLAVEPFPVGGVTAAFDFSLSIEETPRRLTATFDYSRDLFDATRVERWCRGFRTLLAAAVADPRRRLAELPILSPGERHQLAIEWNDTARSRGAASGATLVECFEGQAARNPDAVAVVFEGRPWTYRELRDAARSVARQLRRLGVGPEVRVGVTMERSPRMLAALLGVLGAGAVYVPIDPSYPRERRAFVLEDAGVRAVLTDGSLRSGLPATDAEILCLEDFGAAVGAAAGKAPEPPAARRSILPGHLAYVIYTSGSTGRPKGVEVSHGALINFLAAMAERPGLRPRDVLLAVTSLSFDIAGLELFLPLALGARIELASTAAAGDGGALRDRLESCGATVLQATPATWRMLVESGWSRRGDLEILCGGEALQADLAESLLAGGQLWNLYGPTETTIWSTAARVAAPELGPGRPAAIGRPIANTRIYLLDRSLRPVSMGVAGELCIAGDGVARGYRRRPARTAECFVPDASNAAPGTRLYRTGDLARWRGDGQLEFLGRIDHQVKLRGHRIEPGEVETLLRRHPGITDAAVILRSDSEDQRLVACTVAAGDVSAEDLRRFLRAELPEFMVPSHFLRLESLPLTPNRKVDRGALAERVRGLSNLGGEAEWVAPRTPLEELLGELWADLLGKSAPRRVGAGDNFFHLGGHSLLATRMISRLRDLFGVEIELRELFEAPTLGALARRVEAASKGAASPAPPPIRRRMDDRDTAPLSFAQQRLWFLDQLDPGTPAYNLPSALRLSGRLRPAALGAALAAVVRRHETLRTTFALVDEEPRQRIHDAVEVALPLVDLEALGDRRIARVTTLVSTAARRPFDLSRGPLLRAALLRLGHEDHVLILILHHIVSDGWSMEVLLRELMALYDAAAAGDRAGASTSSLPELPIQYADFAIWQRRWLSSKEVLEPLLGYWRRQLGEQRSVLDLATDRQRPPVQTYRGARRTRQLSAEVATDLRAFARSAGATLFMALLAAFKVQLHRTTGERSITVGAPIANRNRLELEGLIGFFVNTLVLRTRLGGDGSRPLSFRRLLARVRDVTLEAYAHQDLPFEKLVEELAPQRDLSHSPFFQILFQLQTLPPAAAARRDGLRLRSLPVDLGAAKFDLSLALYDGRDTLAVDAEYNADLFDGSTIERLLGHFATSLAAAVADPDRPLAELELLTAPELQQLLIEWNDTEPPAVTGGSRPATGAATLVELFEAQVDRTPDLPALELDAAGRRTTYTFRELDRRANRWARLLRQLGVGPEQLVGILMERSFDLVAGILATLKAGAAYLPLDPAYPEERLAFMLRDAAAPVVLTQNRFAGRLGDRDVRLLNLEVPGPALAGSPDERLPCPANERHLAYAIYTSGSTGTPKGVAIEHRSAVAMLRWARATFSRRERAGMLASTSICFDLSVFEIFLPLCAGDRLILADNALHLPSHAAAGEVTLINTVPSAIAELLAGGDVPPSVRTVNLAGEPLRRDLVEALYRLPGVGAVCNLYGPSEDTTYSTWTRVEPGAATPPAIGRPVAGSRCYVADAGLRPLPQGVAGELYLAGAGLARGYHDRPALTAERFVPDPFSGRPGERLYRTGDLVRYRAGARLDFLGRADHQIKLRGFRIELGEIEAVLRRHPAIVDAVAEVRQLAADPRLLAFFVPKASAPPSGDELRAFLANALPPHMVPAVFVALDALPLTANGKVDRKALPDPGDADRRGTIEYQEPRSATERRVAGVWEEVLGVERVGLHDNFFDLGGHSLLMVRAYNKLKDDFGDLGFPLVKAFAYPTVSSLARFLDQGEGEAVAARARGRDRGSLRRQAQAARRRRAAEPGRSAPRSSLPQPGANPANPQGEPDRE